MLVSKWFAVEASAANLNIPDRMLAEMRVSAAITLIYNCCFLSLPPASPDNLHAHAALLSWPCKLQLGKIDVPLSSQLDLNDQADNQKYCDGVVLRCTASALLGCS